MCDANNFQSSATSTSTTTTTGATKLKQPLQLTRAIMNENIESDVDNCCLQRLNHDQKYNYRQDYYRQHALNGDTTIMDDTIVTTPTSSTSSTSSTIKGE